MSSVLLNVNASVKSLAFMDMWDSMALARTVKPESVSYTHLDVYKRQVHYPRMYSIGCTVLFRAWQMLKSE